MTLDEFFDGQEGPRQLFKTLLRVVNVIGPAELQVTKSQIAFRRRRAFAWVWMPGKYLRGKHAPLVLTLSLRSRSTSPRWRESGWIRRSATCTRCDRGGRRWRWT